MNENEYKELIERKLKVIDILIMLVIACFIGRLFYIQIINGDVFQTQKQKNYERSKLLPAQRGEVFDRNADVPLVTNVDSFAVDVVPAEIEKEKFSTVITRLAGLLKVPTSAITAKLPITVHNSFQSIEVRSSVPYESIVALAENIESLPGVYWRSKPLRNYLATDSFAHIIGYVGDITAEELKRYYNKGYTSTNIIGKAGIEKQYDEILKGKDGREMRTVDVFGRTNENSIKVEPPESGKNLILTIDRNVQLLAEKALGPRIGSAVVLKPASGEVLAMVSYPSFDQNIFVRENLGANYVKLLNNPHNPFLNRAVNATYPPASTFKLIMTAAILNENVFPAEKKVNCLGEVEFGGRVFRCHIRRPGHGPLNLAQGLAKSCDIYYWTVCRDYLKLENIIKYCDAFGFGQKTEIDLPTEQPGLLPTPTWKERKRHEKWLDGDTMNMSIGQGFNLITPLQAVDMVAMIVNNGVIYKPHLLKAVVDPVSKKIVSETKPEVLHQLNINPEVWEQTRRAMHGVVTDGEARYPMKNPYYKLAGKTGTAEVGLSDRWHSWMVAYGPYGAAPEDVIAVAVIVEATNEWEWWAPYAANIILQGALSHQTFDEAVTALSFDYLPQIKKTREAYE